MIKKDIINTDGQKTLNGYATLDQLMVYFVLLAFYLGIITIMESLLQLFRDWKNATGKSRGSLYRHSTSSCHQQCLQQAVALIFMVEGRSKSMKSHLVKSYDQQIEKKNTKALLSFNHVKDSMVHLQCVDIFLVCQLDCRHYIQKQNISHTVEIMP